MKKAYYGHCLAIYGTHQELRDLNAIRDLGFDPVNPNSIECAEGYKRGGMEFFRKFAGDCDLMIFRALPDGTIPAGVAKEVEFFIEAGKPVIELPSNMLRRTLTAEQTRAYLKETGYR